MLKNGCLFYVWVINWAIQVFILVGLLSRQSKKTLSQVLLLVQRLGIFLSNFILPSYRGLSF